MKFDTSLDTREAAAFLTERGYKIAPATLNKKRCVGGGPEFELFGRRPLYTEKALLEWVQARTTPLLRSTSDHPSRSTSGSLEPKPRGRGRTPQATVEAILHSVRERGLKALQEPANIERLTRCDAAAKAQIDQRIDKLICPEGDTA